MQKQSHDELVEDDMQPEYDFSSGVRGKYVDRIAAGSNLVLLEADVAQAFPDSVSVNEALRQLLSYCEACENRNPTLVVGCATSV